MKNFIILLFIFLVAGCATSRTASTFAAAPTPDVVTDKAILYIYRNYAEPTAFAAYLEIDKTEAASLNQEGFTWVYVSPGEHNFKFGWPFLAGMPSVEFKHSLEAGKVYAFQMQGSVAMSGLLMSAKSAIAPTDIEAAKEQMKTCCRYVPSKYKTK